jgi:hypothetical protein
MDQSDGKGLARPVRVVKNTDILATEMPMADNLKALEKRVAALERQLAELRAQPTPVQNVGLDWRQWAVADEEGIEEISRLGREYRRTGRLPDADHRP